MATVYILTYDDGDHQRPGAYLIGPDGADPAALQTEWLTTAEECMTHVYELGFPMFTDWLCRTKRFTRAHWEAVSHRYGPDSGMVDGLENILAPWGDPPDPEGCPAPHPSPMVRRSYHPTAIAPHRYLAERRASGAKEWQCLQCGKVVPVALPT